MDAKKNKISGHEFFFDLFRHTCEYLNNFHLSLSLSFCIAGWSCEFELIVSREMKPIL